MTFPALTSPVVESVSSVNNLTMKIYIYIML